MVVDIPKDVQFAMGDYLKPTAVKHKSYQPKVKGNMEAINAAVDLIATKKPVFYTGGGLLIQARRPANCCANSVVDGLSHYVNPDGAGQLSVGR